MTEENSPVPPEKPHKVLIVPSRPTELPEGTVEAAAPYFKESEDDGSILDLMRAKNDAEDTSIDEFAVEADGDLEELLKAPRDIKVEKKPNLLAAETVLGRSWYSFRPVRIIIISVVAVFVAILCYLFWPRPEPDLGGIDVKRVRRRVDPAKKFLRMSEADLRELSAEERQKLRELAEHAAAGDDLEKAENLYRSLLTSHRDVDDIDAELWFDLGKVCDSRGDTASAFEAYQSALRHGFTGNLDIYLRLAALHAAAGDQENRLNLLLSGRKSFPGSHELNRQIARIYFSRGEKGLSLQAFRSCDELKLDAGTLRDYVSLLLDIGDKEKVYRLLVVLTQKEPSPEAYIEAAEHAPSDSERIMLLSEAAGKFKSDPLFNEIQVLRARVLLKEQRISEASMILNALPMDEMDGRGMLDLAQLLATAGNRDRLRELGREFRKRNPTSIGLHQRFQKILRNAGMNVLNQEIYREWLRESPRNDTVNYLFAMILKDKIDAIAFLEKALEINPRLTDAAIELAENHRLLGHDKEADTYYRRAISQRPRDRELRYGYALVRVSKDGEKALRDYEVFLRQTGVPREDSLPELLRLAQHLPNSKLARGYLEEMASYPAMRDELRLQTVRTGLIYGELKEGDFSGADPGELYEYKTLYLLGRGRENEVLMMPTPPDRFPDFWKVFLCWRNDISIWKTNVKSLREKNPDDLLVQLAADLWERKKEPEEVEALAEKIELNRRSILYFLIAERYRQAQNSIKARTFYLRAMRVGRISPYRGVFEYYSEN